MNLSFFYKMLIAIIIISLAVLFFFVSFRKAPQMVIEQGGRGAIVEHRPRVLLVQSYHRDYGWATGISRGLRRMLDPRYVEVEAYYMDTRRRFDEAEKRQAGEEAMRLARQWQPDVVVAADDNAQQYFAAEFAEQEGIPVVFCGVNRPLELYGYPRTNVTGIIEVPRYRKTVDLFRRLIPGLKRTYVLTDASESSEGIVAHVRAWPDYEGVRLAKVVQAEYVSDWKAAVLEAGELSDLLVIYSAQLLLERPTGERADPVTVTRWTVEHAAVPVAGAPMDEAMNDLMLGGVSESSVAHGMLAGRMVLDILSGTSPAELPVQTVENGVSRLHVGHAQRLGLRVDEELMQQIDLVVGVP
jgi:ABC-type uncharacterized transport system substrate-binding protein